MPSMNLTDLEDYIFAYFLQYEARGITVDGRFARRIDFIKMFEDRFSSTTDVFGAGVAGRHPNIAGQLIDHLIETQALTTTVDKYSGEYHQFDTPRYRIVVGDLIASNPILQQSGGSESIAWREEFAKRAH